MRRKILLLIIAIGGLFYIRAYYQKADLHYTYKSEPVAQSFEDFARRKINFSLSVGVPEGLTEKLTIHNPAKDGYALLYIHGFGATRAEGEAVGDALAKQLNANIYYARLPGHGLNAEAHAAATFDQYLQEMETAFLQMHKLGKKVVLLGTSTGALVATYLAAKHPDKIHALILASPFWDFGDKTSRLLNFPGGLELAQLALGKERDARWKADPDKRQHADYHKYWLRHQKISALVNLNNLRRFIVTPENMGKISVPILGLIYYKDEKHLDDTIDIKKVRHYFPLLGKDQPAGVNPKTKLVEIADGNHVMLSEYVRSDKATILREIRDWLSGL